MCMECRMNPCHPRCPNADEPEAVERCANCGEPIYEGDDYYEIGGECYCEVCVDDARKTAYL